ncbi:hypothetical protein L1887_56523 [Cichorium endivia]|nr:hypothetical protein L1887_56523 [Cichorium endivia]
MIEALLFASLAIGGGAAASVGPTPTAAAEGGSKVARAIAAASPSPTGILKYEPSTGGNYVVGGLYALYSLILFYYVFRRKERWALCLPIGCFFSAHVRRDLARRLPRLQLPALRTNDPGGRSRLWAVHIGCAGARKPASEHGTEAHHATQGRRTQAGKVALLVHPSPHRRTRLCLERRHHFYRPGWGWRPAGFRRLGRCKDGGARRPPLPGRCDPPGRVVHALHAPPDLRHGFGDPGRRPQSGSHGTCTHDHGSGSPCLCSRRRSLLFLGLCDRKSKCFLPKESRQKLTIIALLHVFPHHRSGPSIVSSSSLRVTAATWCPTKVSQRLQAKYIAVAELHADHHIFRWIDVFAIICAPQSTCSFWTLRRFCSPLVFGWSCGRLRFWKRCLKRDFPGTAATTWQRLRPRTSPLGMSLTVSIPMLHDSMQIDAGKTFVA